MRLLITGGAGFIGARLARTLLARGQLNGQAITQIILADQFRTPVKDTLLTGTAAHVGAT